MEGDQVPHQSAGKLLDELRISLHCHLQGRSCQDIFFRRLIVNFYSAGIVMKCNTFMESRLKSRIRNSGHIINKEMKGFKLAGPNMNSEIFITPKYFKHYLRC